MHTAKRSGHWAQASEASMLKCSTQIQQKPWEMQQQDWLHYQVNCQSYCVWGTEYVNPMTSLRVIRREHLTCIGDVHKDLTDVTSSLGWLKRHASDPFESFWSILYTYTIVCSLGQSTQAAFALLKVFTFQFDWDKVTVRNDMVHGCPWSLYHLHFEPPDSEYGGHFVRCANQIQQRRCEFEQWQSSALPKWSSHLHFFLSQEASLFEYVSMPLNSLAQSWEGRPARFLHQGTTWLHGSRRCRGRGVMESFKKIWQDGALHGSAVHCVFFQEGN